MGGGKNEKEDVPITLRHTGAAGGHPLELEPTNELHFQAARNLQKRAKEWHANAKKDLQSAVNNMNREFDKLDVGSSKLHTKRMVEQLQSMEEARQGATVLSSDIKLAKQFHHLLEKLKQDRTEENSSSSKIKHRKMRRRKKTSTDTSEEDEWETDDSKGRKKDSDEPSMVNPASLLLSSETTAVQREMSKEKITPVPVQPSRESVRKSSQSKSENKTSTGTVSVEREVDPVATPTKTSPMNAKLKKKKSRLMKTDDGHNSEKKKKKKTLGDVLRKVIKKSDDHKSATKSERQRRMERKSKPSLPKPKEEQDNKVTTPTVSREHVAITPVPVEKVAEKKPWYSIW